MKATEDLKNEHKGVMLMLRILEKICVSHEAEKTIDKDHMEKILEFFTVFVDTCHHGKEEEFLFPALVSAGIPKEGGPLEVMLAEHDQGRSFVKAMKQSLASYQAGNATAAVILVTNARSYIQLLTQHIHKEENVVFEMADKLLSEERQKGLWVEFEKLEQERIGAGRHEAFHELLHQLKEIYGA
ncbi:MAG: hemerythrin domain-containing protein [Candidatus Eremiobacteraeota bacterium]|nr:hemerythrin domain-containing protein [Candidatus Eremiobacteraeota bacterium]